MHPDQVRNKAASGAESKPSSNNFKIPKKFSSIDEVKAMSPEQINKLTPEQHAQMMQVVAANTNQ